MWHVVIYEFDLISFLALIGSALRAKKPDMDSDSNLELDSNSNSDFSSGPDTDNKLLNCLEHRLLPVASYLLTVTC